MIHRCSVLEIDPNIKRHLLLSKAYSGS